MTRGVLNKFAYRLRIAYKKYHYNSIRLVSPHRRPRPSDHQATPSIVLTLLQRLHVAAGERDSNSVNRHFGLHGRLSGILLSSNFFLSLLIAYVEERRATDFFELNFHLATLLKVFISSRSSLVEFLRLLIYAIISSVTRDTLTSAFSIHIPF